MKLLNLGLTEPLRTQAIYHMLARESIETLIITSPLKPYVCVGYFQDLRRTVNLDYCRQFNIPVYRREVGGGGVLLDHNQVFYQIVLHNNNPLLPASVAEIYEKFSAPPIETYRALGVSVKHRPVNDLITLEGKKISGQGGANIGNSVVFVGSIIMDFDFQTMSRVLNVPDEKFRDKLYQTMQENMSTLKRELGTVPERDLITGILVEQFRKFFGVRSFDRLQLDQALISKLESVESYLASDRFILSPREKHHRSIKISEGLFVGETNFKLPGGLVTAIIEWKDDIIKSASIYGDFTLKPKERISELEKCLLGAELTFEQLHRRLASFYREYEIDIPGCPPDDFARGILKVKETL